MMLVKFNGKGVETVVNALIKSTRLPKQPCRSSHRIEARKWERTAASSWYFRSD